MEKQQAGFKFGKFRLTVLKVIGEVKHNGRTYRLVEVETNDKLRYYSIRLYNQTGRFIKQMLYEPEISGPMADLLRLTANK